MTTDAPVLDADLHVMEPLDLWERRLPEPYRSRTRISTGRDGLLAPSEIEFTVGEARFSPVQDFILAQSARRWREHPHLAEANAHCRPELTLEGMDVDGIDAAVLVPTTTFLLTTLDGAAPDHALALCRVCNDWVAEFAAADPDRFRWWAWLPRQAPEASIEEATRCVRQLGAAGVACTSGAVDGRLLSDPRFEPLWGAIEDLDVPFGIHLYGAARAMHDDVSRRFFGQPRSAIATGTMNGIYHNMTTLPEMIGAGVLERHPRLRTVIMETGSTWLLWLLDRMDESWELYGPDSDVELTMAPSDYFRRQCYVTAEPEERALRYVVADGLVDNLVFTTDYPHHDGAWPTGVRRLLEQPIDDAAKRKILWDNAHELFAVKAPA